MDNTWIIILIGAVVALLGILLLRVGRQVAVFLLLAGVLLVAGSVGLALYEQARATRQAATAATVAAAGQAVSSVGQTVSSVGHTASNVGLTLAVGVLATLLVVALLGLGYLYLRQRQMMAGQAVQPRAAQGGGPWLGGPGAHWQRRVPPGVQYPAPYPQQPYYPMPPAYPPPYYPYPPVVSYPYYPPAQYPPAAQYPALPAQGWGASYGDQDVEQDGDDSYWGWE